MNKEIMNKVWTLDPSHSVVGFTVRHAGISKVRGKFDIVSAKIENGNIEATADATSFNSGDEGRDGHVKSADFLDVERFPTVSFIGKIDESSESLKGELNIHGVTQEVEFEIEEIGVATDPFGNVRAGAEASTTISRKDFDLTWNAALETGGVLVSDKVKINLDVSFIAE